MALLLWEIYFNVYNEHPKTTSFECFPLQVQPSVYRLHPARPGQLHGPGAVQRGGELHLEPPRGPAVLSGEPRAGNTVFPYNLKRSIGYVWIYFQISLSRNHFTSFPAGGPAQFVNTVVSIRRVSNSIEFFWIVLPQGILCKTNSMDIRLCLLSVQCMSNAKCSICFTEFHLLLLLMTS